MSQSNEPGYIRKVAARMWPWLLIVAIVGSSTVLPSIELSRGSRTTRVHVDQAVAVCPVASRQSDQSLIAASPGTAADVSLRWLGTGTSPVKVPSPVHSWRVPKRAGVALLSIGAESVDATDALHVALARETLDRGLYVQRCLGTSTQWWFAGAASDYGRADTIVITNPLRSSAVVDIEALTSTGALHSAASRGIAIPSRSRRVLTFGSLFPGVSIAAVHITSTSGQVHAGIVASEFVGSAGVGVEWLPPTSPGRHIVPLSPDVTSARLIVASERTTTFSVSAIGSTGEFTPIGLQSISITAGHAVALPLGAALGDASALRISSDAEVIAGVIGHVEKRRGRTGDLIATAGAATSLTSARTIVGMRKTSSRLVLAANVDEPLVADISTPSGWHRRINLAAGSAVSVAVPEQRSTDVVTVSATAGKFALMTCYRAQGASLRLASDVIAVPLQTTMLVRPIAQLQR